VARIVIADAGPLIALAGVDKLSILPTLFESVTIPESVRQECLAKPSIDAQRIDAAVTDGWLLVHQKQTRSAPLSASLAAGETDSIHLALQTPEASLLIMDNRLARRYALSKDLHIIGTVRLLDLAEQHGLIISAEDIIQDMRVSGYRVSISLLQKLRDHDQTP
jgi:predicted nucleic acid-binding protein